MKERTNERTNEQTRVVTGEAFVYCCVAVSELRESWTCSGCHVAAHTNMVECDGCEMWYDW